MSDDPIEAVPLATAQPTRLSAMRALEYHFQHNNDLPVGWVFRTTNESLLETLLLFNDGQEFATSRRFWKRDLFATHPRLVTQYLAAGLMEEAKHFYYFYCEVPEDAEVSYDREGYDYIYDKEGMGVWDRVSDSDLCHIYLSEDRRVFGEINYFRYTLIDKTETSWKMKMIGLPHLKGIDYDDGENAGQSGKVKQTEESKMDVDGEDAGENENSKQTEESKTDYDDGENAGQGGKAKQTEESKMDVDGEDAGENENSKQTEESKNGGDVGGSVKTKLPNKIKFNMVICMVYEAEDSQTAGALKNEARLKDESANRAVKSGSQTKRTAEMAAVLQEMIAKDAVYAQDSGVHDIMYRDAVKARRRLKQRQANDIRASWTG